MNNRLLVPFASAPVWFTELLGWRYLWKWPSPNPLLRAESVRVGSSGWCPVEFCTSLNMEIPQPFSWGNLFQCLTTLTVRMFLMFKCSFLYFSLCSLSLLLLRGNAEKSLALTPPVKGHFALPYLELQEIHVSYWSQTEGSRLMLVDFTATDWK